MGIYGARFHLRRIGQPKYRHMAQGALKSFALAFPEKRTPEAVVDVGCSVGAMLEAIGHELLEGAVMTGLDHALPTRIRVYTGDYMDCDLNEGLAEPFPEERRGDLTICQEVLEHIEPENTVKALETLSAAARPKGALLVFSAAPEGQPGSHHVNCRSKSAWLKLLADVGGWGLHNEASLEYLLTLRAGGVRPGCIVKNTMCLTR